MLYSLRVRTFAHLQRLSLDYYDREMGGRIMTRMTTDVEALAQLLQQGLLLGADRACSSCVGVVVILLVLDPRLALAGVSRAAAAARRRRGGSGAPSGAVLPAGPRRASPPSTPSMQESLAGVRVTQSLGRRTTTTPRFARARRRYRDARLRSIELMAGYFPFSQFLSTVAKALVLVVGAHLIGDGTLTSGVLIAFLLYLDQFFSPMQQLSAVFDQWMQARVALGRSTSCCATPSATPEAASRSTPAACVGDVTLRGRRASPTRSTGLEALRGVDLEIPPGEVVALVGHDRRRQVDVRQARRPLLRPDRGPSARRRHAARATLDLRGLPAPARLRAAGAVPVLRHHPLQHRLRAARRRPTSRSSGRPGPSAPTSSCGPAARATTRRSREQGRSLSAGQRQLLCLARAQLVDPAILLLDEATSNLDLATEAQVQRAMDLVAAGTDARCSSPTGCRRPAPPSGSSSSRTGRIVEDGSHDELLSREGRYAELWSAFLVGSAPA